MSDTRGKVVELARLLKRVGNWSESCGPLHQRDVLADRAAVLIREVAGDAMAQLFDPARRDWVVKDGERVTALPPVDMSLPASVVNAEPRNVSATEARMSDPARCEAATVCMSCGKPKIDARCGFCGAGDSGY